MSFAIASRMGAVHLPHRYERADADRSAINRRTASAFSASDNGSKAIIANAAENESALIGSDDAQLKSEPPNGSS